MATPGSLPRAGHGLGQSRAFFRVRRNPESGSALRHVPHVLNTPAKAKAKMKLANFIGITLISRRPRHMLSTRLSF